MSPLLLFLVFGVPLSALALLIWLLTSKNGKRLHKASRSSAMFAGDIVKPLPTELAAALESLEGTARALAQSPQGDASLEAQFIESLKLLHAQNGKWIFSTSGSPTRVRIGEAVELAISAPMQAQSYKTIFSIVKGLSIFTAKEFYDRSLFALERNPNPRSKQFALLVGRHYYVQRRRSGKLSTYDEQALQNDLAART
ncbi:hypothetical protein [Vacuolonema iberomarrocanum]|uniref:hypothetical protein n=1 Tax=Vacuolonema iberomarrocanum TaxID=3454632 RepID=UPI0019EC97E5|nr:hypothetical protein [filamentous cyanobacterium LEGE 07170]